MTGGVTPAEPVRHYLHAARGPHGRSRGPPPRTNTRADVPRHRYVNTGLFTQRLPPPRNVVPGGRGSRALNN